MNASADHLEFAPPQAGGLPRALVLAVIAHLLLVAALTWGLRWKSSTDTPVAEAELWSRVPQQAAPKLVEAPVVAPPPRPPAPVPVQQAPQPNNADIVREREKRQQEEKKREEARQQEAREREREQKQRAEQQQKLTQEKKRAQEEKQQKEDKAQRDKEQAEKLAQEKKRKDDAARQKAQEAREEADRKANLARIAGLAGATGAPSATSTATRSSGPSAGYASKVAARIRSNIAFTESLPNNPVAVVEVKAAPDGTIVSKKLVRSSGNKTWDEAVLRAIDKTETLPRDTDGRMEPVFEINFRPND